MPIKYQEPVSLQFPEFWLVWSPDNRVSPTRRHRNEVEADTEAARLARCNPGQSFYTVRATTRHAMEATTARAAFSPIPTADLHKLDRPSYPDKVVSSGLCSPAAPNKHAPVSESQLVDMVETACRVLNIPEPVRVNSIKEGASHWTLTRIIPRLRDLGFNISVTNSGRAGWIVWIESGSLSITKTSNHSIAHAVLDLVVKRSSWISTYRDDGNV